MAHSHHKDTFYFRIVEEEDETTSSDESDSDSLSDSSLNQMDIDDVCSSVVDDDNSYEFETSVKIVLNDDNSNIENRTQNSDTVAQSSDTVAQSSDTVAQSSDTVAQSSAIVAQNSNIVARNSNIVAQNSDIVDLGDDDDDDEKAEPIPIDPLVNMNNIHIIPLSENQKRKFPTYDVYIFDDLINYLSDKTEKHVVNLSSNKGYVLHAKHLISLLTPDAWLTDTVIQNYMSLLIGYCENATTINTDMLSCYELRGYESVHKWFNCKDLINMDFVVMPINPGKNHWALFVVEIWGGQIQYYDSFQHTNVEKELKLVIKFFKQALVDCLKNSDVKRPLPTEWKCSMGDSPLQLNYNDCGVFTCMNAKHRVFSRTSKFTQEDVPIFRQVIAWELINNIVEHLV